MAIIHVPPTRRTVTLKLHQFSNGLLQPSGSPAVVGSQTVVGTGATTLEGLSDVYISGSPQDGDILTYSADLDKYVVQALGTIDGGTF